MFNIIGMEFKNNEYHLNVIINFDSNNIDNLAFISKLKHIILNKDCSTITIDGVKKEINNNVHKDDNFFNNLLNNNKKIIVGMMIASSILTSNLSANNNEIINLNDIKSETIITSNYVHKNKQKLETLKNEIIDEYYADYEDYIKEFDEKDIKESLILSKNSTYLKITEKSEIMYNFAFGIIDTKENKLAKEDQQLLVDLGYKTNIIGNVTDQNILKNKGFVFVNVSENMLKNLELNQNDNSYVEDFKTYLKHVIYHELTHKVLKGNEIVAVATQKFEFKNENFKKDLKLDSEKQDKDGLKYFVKNMFDSQITKYNELDDLKKYNYKEVNSANKNLYKTLYNQNNFSKYIYSEEASEPMNYYVHTSRVNNNSNFYFNNNEYLSVILEQPLLDKDDIGYFDSKDVRDEIKDLFSRITLSGGIYANMLLFADNEKLSEIEINILKKYISTHIFESQIQNQLSTINEKEQKIIYDIIVDKIDDLYDITHNKYLSINSKDKMTNALELLYSNNDFN